MLSYIKGILVDVEEEYVVVDNQGIGYQIYTSAIEIDRLPPLGGEVIFYLHMQISEREASISLYGFQSREALEIFKLLMTVSTIGPKASLALLSALSVTEIQMAIISGDVKALTKAKGIAKKGAERIIMELKGKLNLDAMLESAADKTHADVQTGDTSVTASVAMALVGLGYSQMEAMHAVRQVEMADQMSEETLLKAALKKVLQ